MEETDEIVRSQLRLPADMHEQLKVAAQSAGRSLNAEILTRLDHSLQAQLLDMVEFLQSLFDRARSLSESVEKLQSEIHRFQDGDRQALVWLTGPSGTLSDDEAVAAAMLVHETLNERLEASRAGIAKAHSDIQTIGREPAYYHRAFPKTK